MIFVLARFPFVYWCHLVGVLLIKPFGYSSPPPKKRACRCVNCGEVCSALICYGLHHCCFILWKSSYN